MPYDSIFKPGLFDGQVVVVTGGGSGIGRCTAHELASLGAAVALVGRKLDKLQAVQSEIAQAGGRSSVHACDIVGIANDPDIFRSNTRPPATSQHHTDGTVVTHIKE